LVSSTRAAGETKLRGEIVDFAAIRAQGAQVREALARRIFALWQPIFSHLDDKDYRFHLAKHVEDEGPAQIRGIFGIDSRGRDRALVIVRVHEQIIGGRVWARLTANAGCDQAFVQSGFGHAFMALEIWRYRLRHPLRPLFLVDAVVSPASYCAYDKVFSGFAPTRRRQIPDAWWPLAEAGAEALSGVAIDGAPREARRFGVIVRDPQPRKPASARAEAAAKFYEEITGGDPEVGVLVMAPLSLSRYGYSSLRFGFKHVHRALSRARRSQA
jgi:hypothetical protein